MAILVAVVFLALLVADILTTRRVLNAGGRELNPLVRWLMGKLGPDAGLWIRVPIQAAAGVAVYTASATVFWVMVAAYVALIANNVYWVVRLEGE